MNVLISSLCRRKLNPALRAVHPSKRAALYPIRLHSPLPYVCESIHALHPFTMRKAAARACLHSLSFYACESTHACGCLFDPCALTAFLCM